MPERVRAVAARLAALLLLLLAQGCGPGTGGTGLPPGGGSSGFPWTEAPTAPLPDRPADLAGPIERIDATVVRIAATDLHLALSDLLFDDGSPATADALRPGVEAQVWRIGERWLVSIRR
jgi:hypothetical protein